MNEIRIILDKLDICFLIEKIKIFHGKNYLKKYEIYRLIEQFINNKTNSEYYESKPNPLMILLNDELLKPNDCEIFNVCSDFNLDADIKLGSNSLLLKYINLKINDIENSEIFDSLIKVTEKVNEKHIKNQKIKIGECEICFNLEDFTYKTLLKLLNLEILINGYSGNMYDLSYMNIIILQLTIIKELIKNYEKKYFIIIDEFIDDTIMNYIENMFKNTNVFIIIISNASFFKEIKNILEFNNQIIDFGNEKSLHDDIILNLPFHIDINELSFLIKEYLRGIKNKSTIELEYLL